MKAVSSLISVAILILITVGLVTLVESWYFNVENKLTKDTETIVKNKLTQGNTEIGIVEVSNDQIGIKNKGKTIINVSQLAFYVNGSKTTCSSPPGVSFLSPGEVAIFNCAGVSNIENSEVKVTGPNGAMDLYTP